MLLEKAAKDKYFRPLAEDLEEYDPVQLYQEVAGKMTQSDFCRALGIAERNFRNWWTGTTPVTLQVWRLRAGQLRREWQQRNWI